jgi:predicted Na+-dependent transporter
MIELISIVASLALCVLIPLEVGKIRNGWVRKNFAGDRAKFLAAYRKQLRLLIWMGIVFGVLSFALAPFEAHAGEPTVKVVAGIIWFVVAGLCLSSLRALANVPDSDPVDPRRI